MTNTHHGHGSGTSIPIDRIVLSEGFQVRAKGIQLDIVRRYTSALRAQQQLPPITIARLDGVYYCVDGWHRLEAHKRTGETEIRAHIRGVTSTEEAEWLAAEGNLRHGFPLKSKDIREAFRRYVGAKMHRRGTIGFKSYRDIAADLGGIKSHTTIRNWMERDFPRIFKELGGDDFNTTEMEDDPLSDQRQIAARLEQSLKDARNHLPGIKDRKIRNNLMRIANEIVMEMHSDKVWTPSIPEPEKANCSK